MMNSVSILFILLMGLLYVSIMMSRKVILTPQVAFSACFAMAVGLCMFKVTEWKMEMSMITFYVILGGVALFNIVSYVTSKLYTKKACFNLRDDEYDTRELQLKREPLLLFIAFQLGVLIIFLLFLVRYSGSWNIVNAIYNYRWRSATADSAPRILNFVRGISFASGYVWIYVLVYIFVFKTNRNKIGLVVTNLLLSVVIDMMSGSRGGTISIILCGLIFFYFFKMKSKHWKHSTSRKMTRRIILICAILVLGFQFMGRFVGRDVSEGFTRSQYIFLYLAGPIYNLNDFVVAHKFGSTIENCATLSRAVNDLAGILGKSEWVHTLESIFPYNGSNGKFMGNVYTTFAMFLHDGGYFGVVFYTTIMAIISQIVYKNAISRKIQLSLNNIPITMILYAYMFVTIFLSFFWSRFYSDIFNRNFLQTIIYWLVIKNVVLKFNLRAKKII